MTASLKFTREQVLTAYGECSGIRETAQRLGCSIDPLRRLMRKLGIDSKPRGRPKTALVGHVVYALFDPREPEAIRYVGLSNDMSRRLTDHLSEARRHCKTFVRKSHKLNWLAGLLTDGLKPAIRTLAIVETAQEAARVEQAYIARLRKRNDCRLTNDTEGGEGIDGNGVRLTPESLGYRSERIQSHWDSPEGESHRQINSETAKRQRLDPNYTGGPLTAEARAKMSAAKFGKPHAKARTAEWNAKIAASNLGKKHRPYTDEERAARRAIMQSPETRAKMSAAAKARHAKPSES